LDSKYELTSDAILSVYHASTVEVRRPIWNYEGAKAEKDLGLGFYTCEDEEYPIKLYSDRKVVMLNNYHLNLSGLKILKLENDINWLLSCAFHRRNFSRFKKCHKLRDKYRKWLLDYDIVIGQISNDELFSAMEMFLRDRATDYVVLNLAQMFHYKDQIALKSDKACDNIDFAGSSEVDRVIVDRYYYQRAKEYDDMDDLVNEETTRLQMERKGRYFSEIINEVGAYAEFPL